MHYIEEDLLMSSESEPYLPPPRIAARICRTKDRVKSSATSSRRNSIASSRSARSAGHGAPQSSHIAQHLRRADLLEKRKAKAAVRNAHAEEVRLRAALLRDAPRNAMTSREERALAAQQAREKFLAQVKANCAEEVQRSKRVAAQQREKRAKENIKLKEEMDARHSEAEKRKELLQQNRRPRTATMSADKKSKYVWKPKNPTQAAIIIQGAWRKRQWARAAEEFTGFGLTLDATVKAPFEEIGERLNDEQLLDCTSRTLKHVGIDASKSRTFLTIFLILGHPNHLFDQRGEAEQNLSDKARQLLTEFNSTLDSPIPKSLVSLFSDYDAAFSSWRREDSAVLISTMVAQMAELDSIWQTIKNDTDGGVAEDYKAGIQDNQAVVLTKLKRMVGADRALKLVRDAVRANRRERAKKKQEAKLDRKPRVAANPEASPSAMDAATVENRSSANPTRSHLESSSLIPPNRLITHELAINKEWKIEAEPSDSARDEIISVVSRDLKSGLEAGLGDVWIPIMAEIIRDRLLSLLTPGNSLHKIISEALDSELIAREVKQGTFVYDKFFAFMNSMLPQLCAPVRDPLIQALSTDPSEDAVTQLARIFYAVDIIRLDFLNFTLQRLAPTLLAEAPGYEMRRFEADLEGKFPHHLLKWWHQASSTVHQEADSEPSFRKIYTTGLVELATGVVPLGSSDVPETLLLDLERLNHIRQALFRIILVGSILSIAKNRLRRDVRTNWKIEAQRMFELPFDSPPSVFVSIIESRYALPATTKDHLSVSIERLLLDAREGKIDHPVVKVLAKKVKAHILARLNASSSEERTRLAAATDLSAGGLPEFVGKIGEVVTELDRVALVDHESHGKWYDMVVAKDASTSST